MGLFSEFKTFIQRGNVIDLAVGVIMGAEFGKIVSSLVGDIIMPPVGYLIGGVNFKDLKFTLPKVSLPGIPDPTDPSKLTAVTLPETSINYGAFLQNSLNFLIVAVCVFMLVKGVNMLYKKPAPATEVAPPPPTPSEKLLTEILQEMKSRPK